MQELDGLQQFEDSTTYEIQTLNEAVENLRPSTHTHNNLDVLNALTTALLADLQGLQQFEDATNYDIHDIREALLPISSAAHTHNNKDVLDTITEQYMRDEAAFHAQTADALHGLSTGLSEVSALAHSHSNKAVLDNITQEMLCIHWNSSRTGTLAPQPHNAEQYHRIPRCTLERRIHNSYESDGACRYQ